MNEPHYLDVDFDKQKPLLSTLRDIEYDGCNFIDCDFSEISFIACTFTNCTFKNCNLKMMKLERSQLDHIHFEHCTLLGVKFSGCSDFLFSVSFEHCTLDYCDFMGKKIIKTPFTDCSAKEVNFAECDASGAIFDQTNLAGATFENTNLSGAYFTTAKNYTLDPELNRVRQARFSWPEAAGLLHKYDLIIE